jgi:hypothetical protein
LYFSCLPNFVFSSSKKNIFAGLLDLISTELYTGMKIIQKIYMVTVVHFNLCLVVYIMFVITNKAVSPVLSVYSFCALVCIWRLIIRGTYPVHMDSSCTYRAYELRKFTKKSEKNPHSFFPSYSIYI